MAVSEWRSRARRLGAEFGVIVVGILVALAVQAWWEGREEREREREYLGQVAANLEATERALLASAADAATVQRSAASLLRAFYDPDSADPDSVRQWLWDAPWFAQQGVELAALRALAAGDLRLIRDDSVRLGVLTLLDRSNKLAVSVEITLEHFHSSYNELRRHALFIESWALNLGPGRSDSLAAANERYPVPVGGRTHPFPTDVAALLRSEDAYRALEGVWEVNNDLRRGQEAFLDDVRALKRLVDRAIRRIDR